MRSFAIVETFHFYYALCSIFIVILPNFSFDALADRVFNTTFKPKWTSLTFIIPIDVQLEEWQDCRRFSLVYCLYSYETKRLNQNRATHYYFRPTSIDFLRYTFYWLENVTTRISDEIFRPIYQSINNFMGENGCCIEQNRNYINFGLNEFIHNHKEYVSKMTDFKSLRKKLNFIEAYYMAECDVNLIIKVGFGSGKIWRVNRVIPDYSFAKEGSPYLLTVGDNWTPLIPYEHPDEFLTFTWFKENVMCLEQSWICE